MTNFNIQTMFNYLAPRYDLFNKLTSLSLDGYWRKFAVSKSNECKNILDVCTGTGELAFELASKNEQRKITGVDFSTEMLNIAKNKLNGENIEFLLGNAEKLSFPEAAFDCVTSGFAMRNVINNIDIVLKEMYRVIKPKGKIIILEMSKPYSKFSRQLYYIYLRTVIYLLGLIIFGKRWPFRYLVNSIINFLEPEQFRKKLKDAGFEDIKYFPLTLGIVGIYTGVKR
ncbi:MAG: ubiquinone/menaquinone biosynthesis methyltransferase [Elusimicrobiota bacterium]